MYEDYEFIGEFFIFNKEKNTVNIRFTGKIIYNLDNGLVLEYNLPECFNKQEDLKQIEYLHGILLDGTRCTLIGPFNFKNTFGFHSGDENHVPTKFGKYRFNILLLGVFYENTTNFESCDFTFNHLQSYMLPQITTGNAEYSHEPLANVDTEIGNIKILNTAQASLHDISNLIIAEDHETTEKIKDEIRGIFNKYPRINKMESLECYLKLTLNENSQSIQEYIQNIYKISQLFIVILGCPIIIEEIVFRKFIDIDEDRKYTAKFPVLVSLDINNEVATVARKEKHFTDFPICRGYIKFDEVFPNWLKIVDDYDVILNKLQNDRGYTTLSEAYADIILLSTYLEGISSSLKKHKEGKYTAPIDKYASPKLKKFLLDNVLSTTEDDLGTDLADLRNELGHIMKTKRMMQKLSLSQYAQIVKIYETIIISDLLEKLGLDMTAIYNYQLIKLRLPQDPMAGHRHFFGKLNEDDQE